jgi:protein O-mannosyl-transferase
MGSFAENMNRVFEHKRFNLIAFAVIAVMVLIAYSNTFTASFHFDDNPAIIENHNIRHVTWENILNLLSTNRPTVDLSLMLNYQLAGLNVVGWHIFNITNHIVNSCLVYLFVLWTLNLPILVKKYGEKAKRMALFCALLFAVHPIHTESVTYIISRSETVTTFFYLLTILFFIKGARTGRFGYTIAALVSSLLAMQSKEWAVTLPAVVLLYDYLFLSEGKVKPVLSRWFTYLLIALPWVLIIKKVTVFGRVPGASYGFSVSTTTGITAVTYLLTSMNVLWTYVRLMILPINQNLDYDYPIAKTLFELPTIISFLGHVAVVVAAFWLYRKKGMLLFPFGAAWFYITLSPVQSFVPIVDVIFEHRMYLPSIGLILAFVAAYEGVFDWIEKRREISRRVPA